MKVFFLLGEPPRGVAGHADRGVPCVAEPDDVDEQLGRVGRAHGRDLAVAADDDRVGVVARVAPAPERRLLDVHERRHLIEHIVDPGGLEGGAVSALVPARVGRRPVEHAVDDEERHGEPRAPEQPAADAGDHQQRQPQRRVTRRGPVAAAHELLHPLSRYLGVIPLGRHQPLLGRTLRVGSDEAVIRLLRGCHPTPILDDVPRSESITRLSRGGRTTARRRRRSAGRDRLTAGRPPASTAARVRRKDEARRRSPRSRRPAPRRTATRRRCWPR